MKKTRFYLSGKFHYFQRHISFGTPFPPSPYVYGLHTFCAYIYMYLFTYMYFLLPLLGFSTAHGNGPLYIYTYTEGGDTSL